MQIEIPGFPGYPSSPHPYVEDIQDSETESDSSSMSQLLPHGGRHPYCAMYVHHRNAHPPSDYTHWQVSQISVFGNLNHAPVSFKRVVPLGLKSTHKFLFKSIEDIP